MHQVFAKSSRNQLMTIFRTSKSLNCATNLLKRLAATGPRLCLSRLRCLKSSIICQKTEANRSQHFSMPVSLYCAVLALYRDRCPENRNNTSSVRLRIFCSSGTRNLCRIQVDRFHRHTFMVHAECSWSRLG